MKFNDGDIIFLMQKPHGGYVVNEGVVARVIKAHESHYEIEVKVGCGPFKGKLKKVVMRKSYLWGLFHNEE